MDTLSYVHLKLDMAKRVGQVGSIGLAGHELKQIIFKWVNRVAGWVYSYFSNKFFFIQLQKQINDNLFRENE